MVLARPITMSSRQMNTEMGVGEMEGAKFKIEPLHRSGEDPNTMRARLLCMFSLISPGTT
jgi:hypothetical protein